MNSEANVDPAEIAKFEALASRWWDPQSEFKPLHEINPLRLDYIDQHCGGLEGKTVIDVGCGGGILSESLAAKGADVTGIDIAAKALSVAKLHLHESGLKVNYQLTTAESWAEQNPARATVVTCMEMLEHVPDPASVVAACADLLKAGGHLFMSTLNRNALSFAVAILGGEHITRIIPKGTHQYDRFIKPSELCRWLRA